MSWSLLDQPLRAAQFWTTIPKTVAETAETQSRVPLNLAQAGYYGAQVPLTQAQTTKAQIENEQSQIFLDQARQGLRDAEGGDMGDTPPPAPPGYGAPAPAGYAPSGGAPGGRGGNIGPGTPAGGQPNRDLMASAQLPRTQFAAQTGPSGAPPASAVLAGTPLGFGGATADQGIMLGGTTAEPVAPGAAGAPAPAGSPQQASPYGTSKNGTTLPGLGITVPKRQASFYWMTLLHTRDPLAAQSTITAARNNRLFQLAEGATSPAAWDAAVLQAWREGWLNNQGLWDHTGHPEHRDAFIRALTNADTATNQNTSLYNMGYVMTPNGPMPSAALQAGRPYIEGPYARDPGTGLVGPTKMPAGQMPAQAGFPPVGSPLGGPAAPAAPAPPAAPTVTAPSPGATTPPFTAAAAGAPAAGAPAAAAPAAQGTFADYAAAVHSHEGFTPQMGSFGWTKTTKADQARKADPATYGKMTNDQIQQATIPPQTEARMMQNFTAENAIALTRAGLRTSAANLGMAHYIGAQGVANLARVPPDMTMAQMEQQGLLAKGSVGGNTELQGNTTARGFIQWAQAKYGNDTITPDHIQAGIPIGGRAAPAPAPAPGGATRVAAPAPAPAPAPTPALGGPAGAPPGSFFSGQPQVPENIKPTLELEKTKIVPEDMAAVNAADEMAIGSQATAPLILDARTTLAGIPTGRGTEAATKVAGYLTTWLPGHEQELIDYVTKNHINLENVPDREKFIKETINLLAQQESQLTGARGGIGMAQFMHAGSPNIDMQGPALKEMFNWMLVRNQLINDYSNGFNRAFQAQYTPWSTDPINNRYNSVATDWHNEWSKPKSIHRPEVYEAAANIINGRPAVTDKTLGVIKGRGWTTGLTDVQAIEAWNIAKRADTEWRPATNQYPPGYAPKPAPAPAVAGQ